MAQRETVWVRGARSDARWTDTLWAGAPRPQEFAQQKHIHGFHPRDEGGIPTIWQGNRFGSTSYSVSSSYSVRSPPWLAKSIYGRERDATTIFKSLKTILFSNRKMEMFWGKISLTGSKWTCLNDPGSHISCYHSLYKNLLRIPFSYFQLLLIPSFFSLSPSWNFFGFSTSLYHIAL